MKHLFIYTLLAILPGNLISAESSSSELSGTWISRNSNIQLEIKPWKKGLKARERSAYNKGKWRKYYRMGYGLYDDCKGRVIIADRFGQITWRNSRRGRSIKLRRYDRYDRSYDDGRYRSGRDRYGLSNRTSRSRRSGYNNDYEGNWYCNDRDLDVEIRIYGSGFRARRPRGEWIYYEAQSNNRYRDRKGNHYFFENGDLYWESSRGRNRLKFSKR